MSKLAFRCNIRSELPPDPESPAALGARFTSTLDTLSSIDPNVFHDWQIMTYPVAAAVPLEDARRRITSIIERALLPDLPRDMTDALGQPAIVSSGAEIDAAIARM